MFIVSCNWRVSVPSCWKISGEAAGICMLSGRSTFIVGSLVAQAVVASFCMIFCTFSSSVALVKGLTM